MQFVIGGLVALVLFLLARGARGAAGAASSAPPATPVTYVLPSSTVQSSQPVTEGASRAPTPIPYTTMSPPPPPEVWQVHDAVQGKTGAGGGSLMPFDDTPTTRAGAIAAGFGR